MAGEGEDKAGEEDENQKQKRIRGLQKIRHLNYSKKVEVNPTSCTRFSSVYKDISVTNSMIYLKLRREGCKKEAALKFGSRAFCCTDSTRIKDGPPSFRVLKMSSSERKLTHNVDSAKTGLVLPQARL